MEAAFAEMPLALFTTLAPMGAGAFVALACALYTVKFTDEQLAKFDKLSLIPVAFVIVGFIASIFHLTNPMNGVNIFAGLGASPLSNEVVVGIVFTIVAVIYAVLAYLGKLAEGSRKGFIAVVAVVAIVFAVFTGMAYMMGTIASWNTIATPVQMIGFALVGGAAVAALVIALVGADASACKTPVAVVSAVGAVLGAGGLAVQAFMVSGMANAVVSGGDVVSGALVFIVIGVVAIIAACATTVLALGGKNATAMSGIAVACAVVGILCARLAFYAMQLSVGLSL